MFIRRAYAVVSVATLVLMVMFSTDAVASVGSTGATAAEMEALGSWIEVSVGPGSHTVLLTNSDFSGSKHVVNHMVCVYAEGLHPSSNDHQFFTLNGIGDSARVAFLEGGRVLLGFIDAQTADNHGGSAVVISGLPDAISVDGIRNCAWFSRSGREQESGQVLSIHRPDAMAVHLAGTLNDWNTSDLPMSDPDGDGTWTITVDLPAGSYEYKFAIDGGALWLHDESNPEFVDDGYGGRNSVLTVPSPGGTTPAAVTSPETTTAPEDDAPSERDVRDAIEVHLANGVPLFWYPTMPTLSPQSKINAIEVRQIGQRNEKAGYWPVRARITGTYMTMADDFVSNTRKPFDVTKEFRLRRDDWGEWKADVVDF